MKRLLFFGVFFLAIQSIGQVPMEGLVGQWKFSGNADESTGTMNNGTVYGASLTTDRCGNEQSAYYFDGRSYIECSTYSMGISNEITISLWFKTRSESIDAMLAKYSWSGDVGYCVQLDNTFAPEIRGRDGNDEFCESNTNGVPKNDGNWHHFVGIVQDSVWSTWIDMVLIGTQNTRHSIVDIGSCMLPLTFGSLSENTGISWRIYTGSLDDINIYNRAISISEIGRLFYDDCSTMSMDENLSFSFSVYPNPVHDMLHIRLQNETPKEIEDAFLVDILGRRMELNVDHLRSNGSANLEHCQKGTYMLFVFVDGVQYSEKLILK